MLCVCSSLLAQVQTFPLSQSHLVLKGHFRSAKRTIPLQGHGSTYKAKRMQLSSVAFLTTLVSSYFSSCSSCNRYERYDNGPRTGRRLLVADFADW